MKSIVLAGGCFWGVQAYFQRLDGVDMTKSGYANGITLHPTYEEVCTGNTNHTEAVMIQYNEDKIHLENILDKFWAIIDPTLSNRQGNDIGTQYRTGIYYLDEEDLELILDSKDQLQSSLSKPIVTEIKPLEKFFEAEEYHQDYLKKNPNGYCHINLNE